MFFFDEIVDDSEIKEENEDESESINISNEYDYSDVDERFSGNKPPFVEVVISIKKLLNNKGAQNKKT